MTITAEESQVPLDSITHISAVPERVVYEASAGDMGALSRATPDGSVHPPLHRLRRGSACETASSRTIRDSENLRIVRAHRGRDGDGCPKARESLSCSTRHVPRRGIPK
jgi:hypothetical protein